MQASRQPAETYDLTSNSSLTEAEAPPMHVEPSGSASGVGRPVRSDAQRFRLGTQKPIVTWAIIAVNVAVWLSMLPFGGSTDPYVLVRFGIKVNELIVAGQIWRLVTPIFLHIGIVHLAFNTYALYIFGPQIERFYGSLRYALIYLLSGIYGVLLSFLFSPHAAAGASGAIFGLIGTEAVFFFRYRNAFGQVGRQRLYNILLVIGYNLAFTFVGPNIDIWGHLGGLMSGIALGWAMMPSYVARMTELGPRIMDRNHPRRWSVAVLIAVALLVVGTWSAIAVRSGQI